MNLSVNDQPARIGGIPAKDGAYWYHIRGEVLPTLVPRVVCIPKQIRCERKDARLQRVIPFPDRK